MNLEHIIGKFADAIVEVLPELEEHKFIASDSLRELGANSIDRSEIIMMVLEELELNIPLVQFAKAANIGELAGIMLENA
ncbi:MAG: acyl carrier protein [Aestuariibacter sp.]